MIEESLLKTNFIGRDGFRWWIGQIPPKTAGQSEQSNGAGWGNRSKVRILGYHPYSTIELPDDDLPWANVLLGTTDGSGAANRANSVALSPGDTVFGFFLDGDNAQVPVIMGVFGRTSQVPSTDFKSPFVPFTGYTSEIENDGSRVAKNESNEQNANSQKSPRSVSKTDAEKINSQTNPDGDPAKKEITSSSSIGKKVTAASPEKDSAVQKIKNDVENFVQKINDITGDVQNAISGARQRIFEEIDSMTASIQKGAARMVNDMMTNLTNALTPVLNQGLQVLYDGVYATVFAATQSDPLAVKAGTIAQALLIGPVKELSDAIPCIANSVIGGIGDTIKGVLKNVADNVANFASCIADQVVGSLMNHIIGTATQFLAPFMGALSKISLGFDPLGFLTGTADAILGLADRLGCNEIAPDFDLASNEWIIGKGSTEGSGVDAGTILETANAASGLAESAINVVQDIAGATGSLGVFDFMNPSVSVPGFKSALGRCYAGPPELGGCGGTKIKIFGGGNGEGGTASAIIGGIEALATGGRGITGSLIGDDLVNGGGGYTFPPFVEVVDECDRGYGASARAIIDYDEESPTYQQITDIYVVTEGENYTVGEDEIDYIVEDVTIVNPGEGYDGGDTVIDSDGDEYDVIIDEGGGIVNIIPRTPVEFTANDRIKFLTFPSTRGPLSYRVKSDTGSGAIIRPKYRPRPVEPQGEIKQVIDCIE